MNTLAIPTGTSQRRPRWLVLDDEPALSEIIADALNALNLASVDNFTSPVDALGRFVSVLHGYDLVVTDRDMPGLNGLEFSRRLREYAPGVPVILVSAHTDDITEADLRQAGIDTVVGKPFTLAHLQSTVREIVRAVCPESHLALLPA